ncbi:hypothetical protein PR202_gb28180 [Eleusine coracana subsp. coracana]|uniref:Peptidase M41 domain-containing protein n=1 Tax=Eleusine coracana subsp. coracana TaxID=191504 RepID=A0AAV5FX82_ELECO|nr:hypothetical protein PR202_gb28180 [Eleusine coracana subsp. coracana]
MTLSKSNSLLELSVVFGGRAAEEVIFGEPEVTTGAAGDLQQITGLAKQMVVTFENNREAIDKIVEVLLEKETINGDEFRAILSEFVEIPVENRVPPATPAALPA